MNVRNTSPNFRTGVLSSALFGFTVAASDSNECTATLSYTLLVVAAVCPSLDLFPSQLPDGARSVPYDQTLLATGGIAPYAYAVSAGSLPAGLVLDAVTGVVSGTPTVLGDFSFSFTVTDLAACATSFDYTMRILPDLRGANCALFGDTFEDGALTPGWTYVKPTWSESGGNLIGTSGKKAIAAAIPAFAGCVNCAIETTMQTSRGGDSKIALLGWFVDKKNTMELSAAAGKDIWMLKQKVGGNVVAKVKATRTIDPNVAYDVRLAFDGAKFDVYVGDMVTPLMSLTPTRAVPTGTVGFQATGTTGTFGYVCVK